MICQLLALFAQYEDLGKQISTWIFQIFCDWLKGNEITDKSSAEEPLKNVELRKTKRN